MHESIISKKTFADIVSVFFASKSKEGTIWYGKGVNSKVFKVIIVHRKKNQLHIYKTFPQSYKSVTLKSLQCHSDSVFFCLVRKVTFRYTFSTIYLGTV